MHKGNGFRALMKAKRQPVEDLTQLSAVELGERLAELEAHRRETMQAAHAVYGHLFMREIQAELAEYQRQIVAIRAEARARVAVYELAYDPEASRTRTRDQQRLRTVRRVAGL